MSEGSDHLLKSFALLQLTSNRLPASELPIGQKALSCAAERAAHVFGLLAVFHTPDKLQIAKTRETPSGRGKNHYEKRPSPRYEQACHDEAHAHAPPNA